MKRLLVCLVCVGLALVSACQPPLVVLEGDDNASEQSTELTTQDHDASTAPDGQDAGLVDTAAEPSAPDLSSDAPLPRDQPAPDKAPLDSAGTPETSPEEGPEPGRDTPPTTCQAGQRRCQGKQWQQCTSGAWGSAKDCPQGHTCEANKAQCVPTKPPADPCNQGCWDNSALLPLCGFYAQREDFKSGKYNVHQYNLQLPANTPTEVRFQRLAGTWQPALIIALKDGTRLTPLGVGPANVQVSSNGEGRTGTQAHYVLQSTKAIDVVVYLTSWAVADSRFVSYLPKSAEYDLQIVARCGNQGGQHAPAGAMQGEQLVHSGSVTVKPGAQYGTPFRVDANAGEHVSFRLDFSGSASPVLEVLAWDGSQAVSLAANNWGPNLRALAALDTKAKRTVWARVKGLTSNATLLVERVPFVDGVKCNQDCARLLQLPLPMDPKKDGYFTHPNGKYVYQFGRRDMLMAVREMGRRVVAAGYGPVPLKDLSKWDGSRPPGHSSHTTGKDIDTGVFQKSTGPVWMPLCQVDSKSECVKGSDLQFDGVGMAVALGGFIATGRVEYVFLDREFVPKVIAGAEALIKAKKLDAALLPAFKTAVRHWPNHHNHAHIRVRDTPTP